MRINCAVNFKKESLQVADYLAFFKKFVWFQPERLSTDQGLELELTLIQTQTLTPSQPQLQSQLQPQSQSHPQSQPEPPPPIPDPLVQLVNKHFQHYFMLSGNGGSILSGEEEQFRFIDLSIEPFKNTDDDLLQFITKPGFTSACLCDSDYTAAQNTKLGKYIQDDSSLKDTPFFLSSEGYKVYDTSYNPGKEEILPFTTLLPAWKMWFGEGFFQYIPKGKVLSFPHALEIKEYPSGIVYVQLFEDVAASNSEAARAAQWAWRRWLDFDGLVKKY